MPEILPDIHQIPVNYNNRPLKLYLLIGTEASLLMDSGDASTPEKDILPYFQSINFDPAKLTYILTTHPDVDHTGGLFRMKQAAPQARCICGTADRTQIESPDTLIEQRYRAHYASDRLGPDDAAKARLRPRCGGYVPMDFTYDGTGELRLGPDRILHILHLPGHSHGHLGVYLPNEKTAIIGDAVQGTGNYFLDGRQAIATTYMYIDESLGTIRQLKAMNLQRLYSCHWPDCTTPEAIHAWLNESRNYIHHAEEAILNAVRTAPPEGLTMLQIIQKAKPNLGTWPPERDGDARFMAAAHLQSLINRGQIKPIPPTPNTPTHYTPT